MKKLEYIYGILTLIIVFIGVTFKINHWPGAGVMLVLGIASLLFIFMPLALVNNYKKEGSSKTLSLYIIGYLTTLVVLGGALFKIMHWPGASIVILIALPFPFVVFLPVFLYTTSKIENFSLIKTVLVLFLMAHLSVFSALLALNISKDTLDSTLILNQSTLWQKSALEQMAKNDQRIPAPVLQTADALLASIDECEHSIMLGTGDTPESFRKDPFSLQNKENQNQGWIAGGFGEPGSAGEKMLLAMRNFKQELGKANPSPALENLMEKLLSTNPINEQQMDDDASLNWQKSIANQQLTWVMDYLEGMKRNVYFLEAEAVQ